jgi:Mg2+/Co2+ transporter CorB
LNTAPLELLFGILAFLILLSGFFSSSETAMMSLNRYRLKHLRKENHAGAKLASQLLERPDKLIGLILIGNNLVNILASAIATIIAIRLYGDAGIAIATLLLTLVILIFAEITPKTIAAMYPEKIAFPASRVLKVLMFLLYPAVIMVNMVTSQLLRLANIDPSKGNNEQLSFEELRTIVGEAGAHIPKRHQDMLVNILDLEDVTVNDIMIPRNEVYGIDLEDDDAAILAKLKNSDHTRIPLYRGDINNIENVLHLRNSSHFVTANGLNRQRMTGVSREPYFVPENTSLHVQLLNFQKEKRRMGIVVDEYGVVLGLVTLEDILEEIVGEFTSNLASSNEDIKAIDNNAYLIDGSISIRDINKQLHWQLPTEGPKTLNGLIMEHLESFPDANVGLEIAGYHLEIMEIGDNVIQKAKAVRI